MKGNVAHSVFPSGWIDGKRFEEELVKSGVSLQGNQPVAVRFTFDAGTRLMVDAGARLLSVANQLVYLQSSVTLEFSSKDSSTFDYLNRVGFFLHLDTSVRVLPHWPTYSAATLYRGSNSGLVEFAALQLDTKDGGLPGKLARALEDAVTDPSRRNQVGDVAFTLLTELIGNVYAHSDTPLSGFAVLQVYRRGNAAMIAVSDSGKGLLDTLKPSLQFHHPRLVNASDTDLLIEALRDGLSRKGKQNGGCGLKVCADSALKLRANLEIRLPESRFHLDTGRKQWRYGRVVVYDRCPRIWGTHIAFTIRLD